MDPDRALPWDRIPSYGSLTGDTVYIAVVDKAGNAASLIHSVYGSFGAAVVAGRTGVVLQNRSALFLARPEESQSCRAGQDALAHADRLARLPERQAMGCRGLHGRRRPAADPYAGLQRDDRPWARHPAGARHAALPVGPLRTPRAARHPAHRGALSGETIAELERRGHLLDRWGDWDETAGHANGITIDAATGERLGGADPRSDGEAVGC